MLQEFLTIDKAAERLKDRGYDYESVQAVVAKGGCPFHVRNMTVLIPFPEADPFFVPVAPKPTPPEPPAPPADPPVEPPPPVEAAPAPAEDDKPKKTGGHKAPTKAKA